MIIVLVIIGLSLLILGHEAGHFLAAKLSGMKVHEFGFGFPPRVFGVRRYNGKVLVPIEEEIQTGIGEESGVVFVEEKLKEIDILEKGTFWKFFWRKEKDGSTGSPNNYSLSEVEGVEGGTTYSFNLLPFGGFVRIAGENDGMEEEADELETSNYKLETDSARNLFSSKPIWMRSLVMLAGVIANFVIGWVLVSIVFMVGIPSKVVVGGIEPGSPAESVGIKPGDIINNFSGSKEFIEFVNANKGKEITLNIFREGKDLVIKATPRINAGTGKGALGIYLGDGGVERQGFFAAIGEGFKASFSIIKETALAFGGMLRSIFVYREVPRDVVGPVGIVSIAAQTSKLGILYFLQLLALISLNLSIMNLLPFPALDGGRFLLLMIEKIKGSPVNKTVESWINAGGFLILIGLMILVTVRDIGRL